jgi:integrase
MSIEELRAKLNELRRKRDAALAEIENLRARVRSNDDGDDAGIVERIGATNNAVANYDSRIVETEAALAREIDREQRRDALSRVNPFGDGVEGDRPAPQRTQRRTLSPAGEQRERALRAIEPLGLSAAAGDRGVARNTVRLAVAPVKALLATAHEEGLIRANPAAGLRLGRTVAASPVKQTHALTEEEVVRVLAEVPEAYQLLADFLAQTGLRISEALALTKTDIDFGRRRLSVSRRLYDGELDAPKSRHGVRRVPLSPTLAQRLWKQLATQDDDQLVFAEADGRALDRTSLYRVVRAAGERAGIEWPVGLHTFRHSCASIMFRRGVPKEAIRRLLGHHSWDFTAGTYVHLDDDDLPDGSIVGDLTATAPVRDAALSVVASEGR